MSAQNTSIVSFAHPYLNIAMQVPQIPTLAELTKAPSFQNEPFKRYPCFVRVLERAMFRA